MTEGTDLKAVWELIQSRTEVADGQALRGIQDHLDPYVKLSDCGGGTKRQIIRSQLIITATPVA